jgi:hypothetical protein
MKRRSSESHRVVKDGSLQNELSPKRSVWETLFNMRLMALSTSYRNERDVDQNDATVYNIDVTFISVGSRSKHFFDDVSDRKGPLFPRPGPTGGNRISRDRAGRVGTNAVRWTGLSPPAIPARADAWGTRCLGPTPQEKACYWTRTRYGSPSGHVLCRQDCACVGRFLPPVLAGVFPRRVCHLRPGHVSER